MSFLKEATRQLAKKKSPKRTPLKVISKKTVVIDGRKMSQAEIRKMAEKHFGLGTVEDKGGRKGDHGWFLGGNMINYYNVKSVADGIVVASLNDLSPDDTRPIARKFLKTLKESASRRIKVTRLDEAKKGIRTKNGRTNSNQPPSSVYSRGLRLAAEAIVKEATKQLGDSWKDISKVSKDAELRKHFKSQSQYVETFVRGLAEELMTDFRRDLEDEIDVALTHMHGV